MKYFAFLRQNVRPPMQNEVLTERGAALMALGASPGPHRSVDVLKNALTKASAFRRRPTSTSLFGHTIRKYG